MGLKIEELYTTDANSWEGGSINITPTRTPKFLIIVGKNASGTYYSSNIIPFIVGNKFACSAFGYEMSAVLDGRYVTITDENTLTFSNGYSWAQSGTPSKTYTFSVVPYKIYGIS